MSTMTDAGRQVREQAVGAGDDVFDGRRVGSIVKTMSLAAATPATSRAVAGAERLERPHRPGVRRRRRSSVEALAAQIRRHGPAHVAEPDEADALSHANLMQTFFTCV